MTSKPSARARLDAYLIHKSEADEAEFTARVDAVVAEETAADTSRLARVERLVEEARDKNNAFIDTDLLLDALGLDS